MNPGTAHAAVPAQSSSDHRFDGPIAAVLRGEPAPWPEQWSDPGAEAEFVQRAIYHGVAGLLLEAEDALTPWPEAVLSSLKAQAVGQLAWEMRHREVLGDLLGAFADGGVPALVLKGSAIAYDLYDRPEARARGDTDLLVETARLADARRILADQGFALGDVSASANDEIQLQELWSHASADAAAHHIDLHWQAMNFPALEGVLSMEDCMASAQRLPRLCNAAKAPDRATMLAHAILHRAGHITSPFFFNGFAHYGGDRLIWVHDMHLLAEALTAAEWNGFCALARSKRIARVCLDGLRMTHGLLGTVIPAAVTEALAAAPANEPASSYLLHSGQLMRSWRDFLAIRGGRSKLAYLVFRTVPSPAFMRAKYPSMAGRAVVWLYLRRIGDLFRKRPERARR